MTEQASTGNAPLEGRRRDGRFAPGNTLGIPFGPDNPPPKSPGRPRKDAWIKELEARLEEKPELRQALADVLLKTALKGSERARLRALDMIEDRVGGPVLRRVETDVQIVPHSIELIDRRRGPNPTREEPR